MKQILLLTILVLVFCLQGFGQENVGCPNLEVLVIRKDSSTLFYISSVGIFDNSKFEYQWTVSNEVVVNGQGTSAISIPTNETMQGQTIAATVEIKGLPKDCQNKYSKLVEFVPLRQPIVCEPELNSDNSWQSHLSVIQNLSLAVREEKGSKALVILKFTNLSEQKKAIAMRKKILKQSKKLKLSLDGITLKVEKGDIYQTDFLFVPPNTTNSN